LVLPPRTRERSCDRALTPTSPRCESLRCAGARLIGVSAMSSALLMLASRLHFADPCSHTATPLAATGRRGVLDFACSARPKPPNSAESGPRPQPDRLQLGCNQTAPYPQGVARSVLTASSFPHAEPLYPAVLMHSFRTGPSRLYAPEAPIPSLCRPLSFLAASSPSPHLF